MSNPTTPPTASELLAKWKELNELGTHLTGGLSHIKNGYAAQLDQMCEDAGISSIGGFPKFKHVHYGFVCHSGGGSMSIAEIMPLLEWLETKGS